MRKFCSLPTQNYNAYLEILKTIGSSQDQINPLFEPVCLLLPDMCLTDYSFLLDLDLSGTWLGVAPRMDSKKTAAQKRLDYMPDIRTTLRAPYSILIFIECMVNEN
jgi:hypothetical protein